MDVDCDGIDYKCKVLLRPRAIPKEEFNFTNVLYDRTIQMARMKPTLGLLLLMRLHGLSSQTSSQVSIPTNWLETTLLPSFGMLMSQKLTGAL